MYKPICRRFDEWTRLGYRIIKGAKHVGRDKDGFALFNEYQVYDPEEVDDWMDPYDYVAD